MQRFSNNAITTLVSGISDSATSLQLSDATNFPYGPFKIIIGSEIINVTSRSGSTLTIQRGKEGTTAVAHAGGETVIHIITTESFLESIQNNSAGNVRLSFSSTVPNQSTGSGTTLYAVPYNGNSIGLLDPRDSRWRTISIPSGIPIGLSPFSSGAVVDFFMYYDEVTDGPKLEGLSWSSTSTRTASGEIVTNNGIDVKFDDPTRRYIGSAYMRTAGYSEDTARRRFLWNKNKLVKKLYQPHTYTTYNYTSPAIRQVNSSSDERVEFLIGKDNESFIDLEGSISIYATSFGNYTVGLGYDSTTVMNSESIINGWGYYSIVEMNPKYCDVQNKGLHYIQFLENNTTGVSVTVYGNNSSNYAGGIFGTVEC